MLKEFAQRRALRKGASTVPTSLLPLRAVRSATVFIDVEDTSFDLCKNAILTFFRDRHIKAEIFFFDLRKLSRDERLITSITTTILKKDLNWFGKPSREKVALMLNGEPDLFISLLPSTDYPLEFMAKSSRAHFKVGRVQLPDDTFDLVIKDPEGSHLNEAEFCKEMIKFMDKIR